MRTDSQLYVRCFDCGEYVNDSEKGAHECPLPKLVIHHDSNPTDCRREDDPFGTMFAWHRRYSLGDHQPSEDPREWLKENGPFFVCLNLYLYDHSGITISTTPFSCPWDSSQVGCIVVKAEDVRKEFGVKGLNQHHRDKVIKILEAEVKAYDQYLRGAVWGFEYGDDSCWGFFGDELEETGIVDALAHHNIDKGVIDAAWGARNE